MQFARVKKKKEAIVNNFVHSDSNYGSLLWHFSSKKSEKKSWKEFKEGVWNLYYMLL